MCIRSLMHHRRTFQITRRVIYNGSQAISSPLSTRCQYITMSSRMPWKYDHGTSDIGAVEGELAGVVVADCPKPSGIG